jgi:cobalt-zinc-cadmium efflux system membrane fusion protein
MTVLSNHLASASARFSLLGSIGLGLLGALSTGCHKPAPAYVQPTSEADLTDAQVATAKVVVETASEKDLDDTLATAGRVAFEDIKVGHIYSPVSGRVARIDAQLGQRVK